MRNARNVVLSASVFIAVGVCTPSRANAGASTEHQALPECPCHDAGGPLLRSGVIWNSASPLVAAEEIAERAAPILWFSPDESLLQPSRDRSKLVHVPEALPCDRQGSPKDGTTGVVYYHWTEFRHWPEGPRSLYYRRELTDPQEKLDVRLVSGARIRYFFYYPHDRGTGAHDDDLESVEVTLRFNRTSSRYEATVYRVIGFAHGPRLFSNILYPGEEILLPHTVLVEENKHGSCPDRNGDGHYTPGYDVNRRVNDAWGVRDVLGSGHLGGSYYKAWMSKPRHPEDRIGLAPSYVSECCLYANYFDRRPGEIRRRYELRSDESSYFTRPCNGSEDRLEGWLERDSFGEPPTEQDGQFGETFVQVLYGLETDDALTERMGFGLRFDSSPSSVGVYFAPYSLVVPFVGGWIIPKTHFLRSFNGDMEFGGYDFLYEPSISRWIDWYVGFGVESVYDETASDPIASEREDGSASPASDSGLLPGPETRAATEFGFKFRIPKAGFVGIRLGIRAVGISRFDDLRLIAEVGLGPP